MPAPLRSWRVWVTRARPGATATAAAVRDLGHEPWVAPLIETHPLARPALDLAGVTALAFTSAAGVRAFAALDPGRSLPVFAVGRATAAAAREAGFGRIAQADGAGGDLAALIAAAHPDGIVLAPGARAPAFDLPGALAARGLQGRPLPVYETRPLAPPPGLRGELEAGRLDAVLLQSASAGQAVEVAVAGVSAAPAPLLLALSPACLAAGLAWPSRIAAAPRERDLLALLPRLDRSSPAR